MSAADAVLARLAAVLPDGAVVTDPDRLASYRADTSTGTPAGTPLAAVLPRTTEQVAAVLAAAHTHRVPVVPRGAGTGLSGGANAVDGCLVLSLQR
nr:FAD-binding protein [Actinomycetes bacterium]